MNFTNNFLLYNRYVYTKNINKEHSNNLSMYNIYFLKKERTYTKLKYSRVPQFDTASGAVATLLAAFYGFLVTEKFGFEMIDSGDFYMILMYVIFLVLALRVFYKTLNTSGNFNNLISFKNVLTFYWTIFSLLTSNFKFLLKKYLI